MKVRKILPSRSVLRNPTSPQQIEVNVSIDIYLHKCTIINISENIYHQNAKSVLRTEVIFKYNQTPQIYGG